MVTRRRPDAGLTLVELMVTIIVASLVATSTFMFFAGQQRIYETQTKMLNTQQNVWAAMETVTRYVRAAGTGMLGCVRPDPDNPPNAGADTGDPPPVPAPPAARSSTAFADAPRTGLRAFLQGTGLVRIPPLWISDGGTTGPDTLTIAYGDGTFGNWSDADLGAFMNTNLDLLSTVAGLGVVFRMDDFVLVLDKGFNTAQANRDRGCTLFWLSAAPVGTELKKDATGKYARWNAGGAVAGLVPFTYNAGGAGGIRHFGQLRWIRFAIQPGTGLNPPRLTMQRLDEANSVPQTLAEGIEDMQIAYACDNVLDNGLLDEGPSSTDEWILNHAADNPFSLAAPPSVACNRPEAIRITLVSRSISEDPAAPAIARPAVENRPAAATTDRFRRRIITSTVYPRN